MRVPFYRQINSHYCGAACLQMVFTFFGKKYSQKYIGRLLGTSPDHGTKKHSLIQTARSKNFHVRIKHHAGLTDIKDALSKKLPPIVNFTPINDDFGHFAVVTGYRNRRLIFNDPWYGRNTSLPQKTFLSRWHNADKTYEGWMITIHPATRHSPPKKN